VVFGTVGPAVALFFMILGTVTRRRRRIRDAWIEPGSGQARIGPAIAGTIFSFPSSIGSAVFTEPMFNKFSDSASNKP